MAIGPNCHGVITPYRRAGDMIALEAANPAFETRILPQGQIKVQGKLVGLIRTY